MKVYFVVFLAFITSSCWDNSGSFSFHSINEHKFTEFQRKNYIPRTFHKYKSPVQFNEDETLWFAYEPSKVVNNGIYAVSLSRKSLGWIEIDLKNVKFSRKTGYLIDNYPKLKSGRYLLTVAIDNTILNSVEFEILKQSDQREDYIDYDMPLNVVLDSDVDDLRALSRD